MVTFEAGQPSILGERQPTQPAVASMFARDAHSPDPPLTLRAGLERQRGVSGSLGYWRAWDSIETYTFNVIEGVTPSISR